MVNMHRGDIFLCDFGDPTGSGPGFIRPVIIIQDNRFNDSRLATTVALSLTSNLKYKIHPGCLLLKRHETGLSKDSVVNATQISTVDKSQLLELVGTLPDDLMIQVENCMRVVLGMD